MVPSKAGHHTWTLNFIHVTKFQVHGHFHSSCFKQNGIDIDTNTCIYSIKTPKLYIPLSIFTSVITLPDITEMDAWNPFIYTSSSPPKSWTTSTIYYINCTWSQEKLSHRLQLTMNEVKQICYEISSFQIKPLLCFDPKGLQNFILDYKPSARRSKSFILTLFSRNIFHANMALGTLSVANIWKQLCGNGHKVCSEDDRTDAFAWETKRCENLLCSELIVSHFIYTNFFDTNNSYSMYFYVDKFNYAALKLQYSSLKLLNATYLELVHSWEKVETNYNWEVFSKKYKLFFNSKYFSWLQGEKICTKHDMHLPSFHNHKHLITVTTFIRDNYRLQPFALLLGNLYRVTHINDCT